MNCLLARSEDGPGAQTVHALGNLKDQYFTQQLEQRGVEVYEAAIALVRSLRVQEIKTAVVSSSNNCAAVLEAAGIAQLFDARVDGIEITRLVSQRQAGARCFSGSCAAPQGRTLARRGGGGRDRRRRGGARGSLRLCYRRR